MRWNRKKNFENDKCSAKDQHQSSDSVLPGGLCGILTCHQREEIPILFWVCFVLFLFFFSFLLKVKCLPTFLFNRKKENLGQFSFLLLLQRQPLLWPTTLDLGCCLFRWPISMPWIYIFSFTREMVFWFSVFFSLAGWGLSLFGVYPHP